MKEIIERLYPEELGVITTKPVAITPPYRIRKIAVRENMWSRQKRSVKMAVITLLILLVAGCVYYYNLFITESYDVVLEVAQMDAEVTRKEYLITGIKQVVEEYMTYEGRVFIHAAEIRNALEPVKEQALNGAPYPIDKQTNSGFKSKSALSPFQAVAEGYPTLRLSEAYHKLMLELANTETRMATARNRYNAAATNYNNALALIPGCLFGYLLRFKPVPTFSAEKTK